VEPAQSEGLGIAAQAAECLRQLESEESARQELLNAMATCDSTKLSAVTQRIHSNAQLSAALYHELRMVQPSHDMAAECYAETGKIITPVKAQGHEVAADILCGKSEPSLVEQLSQWQAATGDICSPPPQQTIRATEDELEEQKIDMGLEELDSIPDVDEPANLLSLNLKVNKIKQATGLASCTALRELLLNDNQIEALGEITQLTKLRQLSVDMNRLKSLDRISSCSCLRIFSASNNSIESVAPLGDCAELEKLTLYRNQVSDLESLSKLRWLQHLDLGRNALKTIDGLGECPVLQTLILYENQIEHIEPRALNAPLLRELWLSGNPLKSLDFAQWLPSLEHLHVSDAEVGDVSPLATCGLLQTLDLSFNDIADLVDLAALAACPLMQVLRMNDNPVAALPGYKDLLLSALPALRDLDNEAVNDLPSRTQHMQHVFTGSTKIDSSALRSAWWLNDQTGDVDWQRVLRSESSQAVDTKRDGVWATRTFRHSCLLQRNDRAELVREQKRNMRTLEAHSKASGGPHAVVLTADEDGAAKVRVQLQEQHNSQRQFSAKSCQNVLVKNASYCSRVKQWRERTACVSVQSRWRGWFVRHQIHQRKTHAAVTIQMYWSRHFARLQEAAGGREAVRIQAMFRGHHVRRRLKHALDSAKYIADDDDDDLLAVDEDEFALPGDLDTVWVPDMRKSLELGPVAVEPDTPPPASKAPPPRRDAESGSQPEPLRSGAGGNSRRSVASVRGGDGGGSTEAWDAPRSDRDHRDEDTSPVFPSVQTPPRQQQQEADAGEDLEQPSPTGTARSARHTDRVAGMFDRMREKEKDSTIVNEWGLSNPETIAALKKKTRRTRRHDTKVKAKKATAAQRLDHYRATQGSSSGWSDAGSVRSTPAPSPTPPMSARSDSSARINPSLVRRIGSSAPPSPANSSMSETGGLQQFNSGQPNQRASRDLASRGSSGGGSRQPTPKTQTNNFLQPVQAAAAAPAAAASAPWGMAAQAQGGRISAPVVSRGANAKRKKVKKHIPRVAGLAR
jgi:Leucine-rich repeat (LRR) protein